MALSEDVTLAQYASDDSRVRADLAAFIEGSLAEDLSNASLARRAAMSPSCFARWFKAGFGKPPHQFVTERRVEAAKQLIREGRHSLGEIALTVGFKSQACLNVAFLKHAGCSTGGYRLQVQQESERP